MESGSQPDSFLLYGRECLRLRVSLANETDAGKGNK